MSLAVCMIVKDETQRIVPCLEPLTSIADEVIVVDTGSTDGTPELLRERFGIRVLHDALEVHHHPEERKDAIKTAWYRQRLECAIGCEPHWLRYHWFLGYMDFLARREDDARRHLHAVTDALPPLFPVECLNSFMVSIELAARANDVAGALARCDAALAHHDAVRDDFEVRVNFRLRPWLEQARADLAGGRADAVRAYRFGR